MTTDIAKKNVLTTLLPNGTVNTKLSPSSSGILATTSSKKSEIPKKQEFQKNTPKKDIVDQHDSYVTVNENISAVILDTITNYNTKTNKTFCTKPCEKTPYTNSQINISNKNLPQTVKVTIEMSAKPTAADPGTAKSREDIKAEREAKKLAKQAKKSNSTDSKTTLKERIANMPTTAAANVAQQESTSSNTANNIAAPVDSEKTREQIKADREAKKKAKQALKEYKTSGMPELNEKLEANKITENAVGTAQDKKKTTLSKAERRALQEAQRAAKAQTLAQKATTSQVKTTSGNIKQTNKSTPDKTVKATPNTATLSSPNKSCSPLIKSQRQNECKVRLFNHLEKARHEVSLFLNNPHIHPSMARLGEQYSQRTVVGSNARCIAFLNALKMVIRDFETPPKKEFARSLETTITNSVDHLQKCRPLAVSVSNAYKHIKHVLTQMPTDQPESDLKENLCRFIDTYIENQIGKAAEAISYSVQQKISNGDVILTFGCSSLITFIFEEAQRRCVNFRVIIVDSRPFCEGQELLRRLTTKGIPCSYVLINAISFVMPESTKVLLGAHALLANGYVMARTGTAQVALVAHSFNVPVLVCCETHKFSERSQTDAIVYNELGNPNDLIRSDKCSLANWQMKGKMVPLNLMYDITPPELVTAVVTEVSILPCTSVPVILRIKPTEIGY